MKCRSMIVPTIALLASAFLVGCSTQSRVSTGAVGDCCCCDDPTCKPGCCPECPPDCTTDSKTASNSLNGNDAG